MPSYKIPLTPEPQRFEIQLGKVTYSIGLEWCEPNLSWILNLYNAQETPILQGIPLVTGVDLFEQYEYLGLGGGLYATTSGDPNAPPTFENLGTLGHLYFVTP